MRSKKPICAIHRHSEVSPTLPLKRFQCSFDWRWPSLALSRKIVERFLFPRLSAPGDRWCAVLGFVPAVSVSSSSTLQIFREESHLRGLLCPPIFSDISLHSGIYRAVHQQEVWKVDVDHWHISVWVSHSNVTLFAASSLNLWRWWHMWSDCHLLRQSSGGQGWLLPPPLSRWSLRPYRLHCLHGR